MKLFIAFFLSLSACLVSKSQNSSIGNAPKKSIICVSHKLFNYHSIVEDSIDFCYNNLTDFDSIVLWKNDRIYYSKESESFDSFCISIGAREWGHIFSTKLDLILSLCQGIKYSTKKSDAFYAAEYLLVKNEGDCEDKALLCARLVHKILGFDVILIDYPLENHINLGVAIPRDYGYMKSDNSEINEVYYNGVKYTVLEPVTYGYQIGNQLEGIKTSEVEYRILELVEN